MALLAAERSGSWIGDIRLFLRCALSWWLGELIETVPAPLRRRLAGLRPRLVLTSGKEGVFIAAVTGNERRLIGPVDLTAPESLRAALATLAGAPDTATLSLAADSMLQTRFTLPLAAERNLDAVIGYEFERLMPFPRGESYDSYRILGRDRAAKLMEMELTVLRRDGIDPVIETMRRAGLHVTGIAAGETGAMIPLKGARHNGFQSRSGRIIAGLAILDLFLAMTAMALPLLRGNADLQRLETAVADARQGAGESAALGREIVAFDKTRDFLARKKNGQPTMVELLDEVTRLTPDDSWMTEFAVNGTGLRLVGSSASAATLLSLIDRAPHFRDAAFRSSVTQDRQPGRERFDIGAEIAPGEMK